MLMLGSLGIFCWFMSLLLGTLLYRTCNARRLEYGVEYTCSCDIIVGRDNAHPPSRRVWNHRQDSGYPPVSS